MVDSCLPQERERERERKLLDEVREKRFSLFKNGLNFKFYLDYMSSYAYIAIR